MCAFYRLILFQKWVFFRKTVMPVLLLFESTIFSGSLSPDFNDFKCIYTHAFLPKIVKTITASARNSSTPLLVYWQYSLQLRLLEACSIYLLEHVKKLLYIYPVSFFFSDKCGCYCWKWIQYNYSGWKSVGISSSSSISIISSLMLLPAMLQPTLIFQKVHFFYPKISFFLSFIGPIHNFSYVNEAWHFFFKVRYKHFFYF